MISITKFPSRGRRAAAPVPLGPREPHGRARLNDNDNNNNNDNDSNSNSKTSNTNDNDNHNDNHSDNNDNNNYCDNHIIMIVTISIVIGSPAAARALVGSFERNQTTLERNEFSKL